MPSLANTKDKGISNLDPRVLPEWQLLEFGPDRKTYDQEFYQSTISEFADIAGWPVDIYLYTPSRPDFFFGESTIGEFDGPYRSKMLFEQPGESYLINVLGFVGADVIQNAEMPKALWVRDIGEQINKKYDLDFDPEDRAPLPGDVVHILWDNQRFQVANVTSGNRSFMGVKHTWTFILKPYMVGNEGPTEKEMLFDSQPAATETTEENDTYNVFTNVEQNREKNKMIELANSPKKKEVEKLVSPEALDTSYYGYFNGLRKKK